MKKIFIYSLMLMGTVLGLSSCGDEELTDSRVTHFALLELNGDSFIKMNVGDTFTEPGFTATEGDQDITDKVITQGAVDTSTPGIYDITYSVSNVDGFSISETRTVMVVDPDHFASAYLGESQYGTRHYYDAPINITHYQGNTYLISDILGGFYAYGRYPQYLGSLDFLLEAYIQLNDDNTIEVVRMGSWYWGDDVPELVSGNYDPTTGTVTLNLDFGNPFTVILTK